MGLPSDAPPPRLCHVIKRPDFPGYGFNLHAERTRPGQFIGKVDEGSPAEAAGLREGDRIVEVNGMRGNPPLMLLECSEAPVLSFRISTGQ